MNKHVLEGMVSICLALALPACQTVRQTSQGNDDSSPAVTGEHDGNATDGSLVRHTAVPLLQVDASTVYRQMLTYIASETNTTPQIQAEQLTVFIDFPAAGTAINPKYGNNPLELGKLKEHLGRFLNNPDNQLTAIHITGFASPDGNTKENERLAGNRAVQFKNYLINQFGFPNPGQITIDWTGEDWDGLAALVSASDKKYKKQVLDILNHTSDPDRRRQELKALDKGAVYKDIEKEFFYRLRRMELNISTESENAAPEYNLAVLASRLNSNPEQLSLNELLALASLYRPGTEQYREVYEIAAYRFPECKVAQLNSAAAALSAGDKESALYFFQTAGSDPRAWNNLGVLAFMEGKSEEAISYFRKALPQNPRLAHQNIDIAKKMP